MEWNADLYDSKHDFVAEYGKGLLEYVPNNNKQIILDLGCGTGSLTKELTQKAEKVIGIDGSADMIEQGKKLYPEIEFRVMDACNLIWKNEFDIIFSNAVFHWIKNQDALLNSIYDALKNNGRLICEFGAIGNISKIQTAFQQVAQKYGYNYINNFYFPTTTEYQSLLKEHGFVIELITDYDRPTPLNDKEFGVRNWIKQFFASDLSQFSEEIQNQIFMETEAILKPQLWDGQQWIADYRRIRVVAVKNK